MPDAPPPTDSAVRAALATVLDPEIRKPITDLGMVAAVTITELGDVVVDVLLTTSGCPLRERIISDVTAAVEVVAGVVSVDVRLGVMTDDQRAQLRSTMRGGAPEKAVPFMQPGSLTRVFAIASGKGGVGKSSVTVNLAVALAASGQSVGVLDADIHGFSIPRMLGVTGRPTKVGDMMMPPFNHGVKTISIGMFLEGNAPVVWRGPMLHRALQQFLVDVAWGDLDVLLIDLPPGTGDMAISLAQLLPTAEVVVVTTPQQVAAEVAERAGSIAVQTKQRVAGVIENMSWLSHVGTDGVESRIEVFGSGGGRAVSDALSLTLSQPVELLGQVPLDQRLREGGDAGMPLVLTHPDAPAAQVLRSIAARLSGPRGLVGRPLGLTPVGAGR